MVKRAETGVDNRHNFLAVVVVDSHSTGRYLLKVILGGHEGKREGYFSKKQQPADNGIQTITHNYND